MAKPKRKLTPRRARNHSLGLFFDGKMKARMSASPDPGLDPMSSSYEMPIQSLCIQNGM
jgi:hypothetical protein